MAFRKNTLLRKIIGRNTIRHNQKLMMFKQNLTKGQCIAYNTSRCLLCQQIIATTTFERTQTKEKFNIYYTISWKKSYVIYLLECLLCKIQSLQNTVCLKVGNPFSHKIDQPQKGYKKSQRYQTMQKF